MITGCREQRKRTVAVKVSGRASENWNAIFGSEEEIAERRRKAIEEQKRQQEFREVRQSALDKGPGVIQDTLKREWYPSLGKYISSRSELKQTFVEAKRRGVNLEPGR